jgi:hypothetical protein
MHDNYDQLIRKRFDVQTNHLSRVYGHFADLIKRECRFNSPLSAFLLHRRITPAFVQLMTSIAEPHDNISGIAADSRVIQYYKTTIHDIQTLLYDDEWIPLSNDIVPFELSEVPSNPRPRFDPDVPIDQSSSVNPIDNRSVSL